MTLDAVASIAGASRFHLSRVFSYVTGLTLKRYIRDRRLSLAAQRLAVSGCPVTQVALEYGYASHEGFTRAFRERFAVTPEQISRQGHVENLNLQEAIRMPGKESIELTTPKIIQHRTMNLAGICRHYVHRNSADIPSQWQNFNEQEHLLTGKEPVAYGVLFNVDDDDSFDYLAGVEVDSQDELPDGMTRLTVGSQQYAAFGHGGHVSEIQSVCRQIWGQWLPESGFAAAEAPMLEVYPASFDPATGYGGYEIWVLVVR